jgi:hypothetical protein
MKESKERGDMVYIVVYLHGDKFAVAFEKW